MMYPLTMEYQDQLLREAWHIKKRDKGQNLLKLFHELGGSRNMCLGVKDVEVRVVHNLKLEENFCMEAHGDLEIRRRRRTKAAPKKRSEEVDMATGPEPANNSMELGAIVDQASDCRAVKDEEDSSDNGVMDVSAWDRQMETKVDRGA
jgi:hypothetical protein